MVEKAAPSVPSVKQDTITAIKQPDGQFLVSFLLPKEDVEEVQKGLNNSMVKMFLKGKAGQIAIQLGKKLAEALKV